MRRKGGALIFFIFLAVVMLCLAVTYFLFFSPDWFDIKGDSSIAKIDGKEFYVLNADGGWDDFFVKGVNIGATKPGFFPGEFGITKEDYLRWFEYIGQMNANTIRVYVAQMPCFYEALYEYNKTAESPIYLFQGIYLNEEIITQYNDAFCNEGELLNSFISDIQNATDIIHGNADIEKVAGNAYGTYDADVSKYVIGWILGIEWSADFVIGTNESNPEIDGYSGTYVYTENASAFEAFLAQAADAAISYEFENYGDQRPVALSNWVTTDPLSHPGEPNPTVEDAVSVDAEHIRARSNFFAGFFASYHVYPYYPEFFSFDEKYISGEYPNTYLTYLNELNSYHTMPVLVAEFGIPTSRGITHENEISGYNQGHIEESEQGEMLVSLLSDIHTTGMMGGLVFSWQDEWFKTTWNTKDLTVAGRRANWADAMTCEENFGLLAFEAGATDTAARVDGDVSEWNADNVVATNGLLSLSVKSDEEYLYLMADLGGQSFEDDTFYIPIDTIAAQGNSSYHGVSFSQDSDFLLILDGEKESKLLVDPYYDIFHFQYAFITSAVPKLENQGTANTKTFVPILQALSRELVLPSTGETIPFRTFDSGVLAYGNANPDSEDYCSLADFCQKDGYVEIRIPWLLLGVMDPSSKVQIADLYENEALVEQDIDTFRFGITVSDNAKTVEMGHYSWEKWDTPSYHERLKKAYYIMQAALPEFN